jgi:hypothetical protein
MSNEMEEQQRELVLAKARSWIDQLSEKEIKDFGASEMEALPWLELKFYCMSIVEGLEFSYQSQVKKKEKMSSIKLGKSYISFQRGEKIVLTILSRVLCEHEVDKHRNFDCVHLRGCTRFACQKNVQSFSCLICPLLTNQEAKVNTLDICTIARI